VVENEYDNLDRDDGSKPGGNAMFTTPGNKRNRENATGEKRPNHRVRSFD
jgi:hypothetical protein